VKATFCDEIIYLSLQQRKELHENIKLVSFDSIRTESFEA